MTSGMNLTARTWLMVFDVVYLISTYDPTPSTVTIASPRFDESESCEFSTSCRSSCSAPFALIPDCLPRHMDLDSMPCRELASAWKRRRRVFAPVRRQPATLLRWLVDSPE